MDLTTILFVVVIILLLGGGGWYGRGRSVLTKGTSSALAGATQTTEHRDRLAVLALMASKVRQSNRDLARHITSAVYEVAAAARNASQGSWAMRFYGKAGRLH